MSATLAPDQLRSSRHAAGLTQKQVADRLKISQAYLAFIEQGSRALTAQLQAKLVRLYQLGNLALPLDTDSLRSFTSASLAAGLASVGYSGFLRTTHARPQNPAVLVLAALSADDLEVRVIEALPWLVYEYSNLNWTWLIREAKLADLQNRLGFVVTLAKQLADQRANFRVAARLHEVEQVLDRARLVREDTLCQASLSDAERRWLRQTRPAQAEHWNLLTDLQLQTLPYAA